MPVVIVNKHIVLRPNRGRNFDLAVVALSPKLQALQSAGIRDIRQLAKRLNDDGLLAPSGRPFSYGTMRRILARLHQLHLGTGPRTLRSAANQRPHRPYKPRPRKSRRPKNWSTLKKLLAES
jgi:hypothetical protein